MLADFARTLIDRGILNENTKIIAHYKGVTLDGSEIEAQGELLIKKINEDLSIEATPLFGQTRYRVKLDDIMEIDGMDPKRLGRVFNINPDGSLKNTGKKRGRKPKNYSEV